MGSTITICLLVLGGGYLSGLLGGNLETFTNDLRIEYPKALLPPNWVFPIVWTFLYIGYGYFLSQIFFQDDLYDLYDFSILKLLAILGLVLNYVWTFIFFRNRFISLLIIIGQIVIATLTIINLKDWVLIAYQFIYLSWLTFATILNFQVL